jgi:hypothetical protein
MSDPAMTPEKAAALRAPFGAEHIGKLPKITCRDCSRAQGSCCNQHKKSKCSECGNYISERHAHLDYAGHGAVTHRLLEVDPLWNWEPLGVDPSGMPSFIFDKAMNPVGFWIKLTVCGVTRLGFGSCPANQSDAEKVLIGDALRNAAMRFGVGLDLWVKGHAEDSEQQSSGAERRQSNGGQRPPKRESAEDAQPAAPRAKVDQIMAALDTLSAETTAALQAFVAAEGMPEHPRKLNAAQADQVLAKLAELRQPAAVAS